MTSANNSVPNQTATILTDGDANTGGNQTLSKGRLNFGTSPYTTIQPHHIITLIDSQAALTQATSGYRPLASVNDVWIGTDVPSGGVVQNAGHLAFGAQISITNYIAQTGDGVHANWLERLSASLKEFNIPAKSDQSVALTGLANGCLNVASGVIASTGSPCGTGGGGGGNTVFGRSGAVVAASGDYTVSQITGAAPLGSPTFTGTPVVPGDTTTSTTVQRHPLSSNVTRSSSDPTTGTLSTGQMPAPTCSWITVSTRGGWGNAFSGTNKAIVWGVYNLYPCVTKNVAYVVGTADNTSNNYALGLYSGTSGGTGALVATTASTAGTTFASSTGIKHIAWSASNVTVPAGRIYIALTRNCASTRRALLGH